MRSTLASNVPWPNALTICTVSSNRVYWIDVKSWAIPSLVLWHSRKDRSTISLHCPGWDLGTKPMGLTWHSGTRDWESGPIRRPAWCSCCMRVSTTAGLWFTEQWFRLADHSLTYEQSIPTLNPSVIPRNRNDTYLLSGWLFGISCHAGSISGEVWWKAAHHCLTKDRGERVTCPNLSRSAIYYKIHRGCCMPVIADLCKENWLTSLLQALLLTNWQHADPLLLKCLLYSLWLYNKTIQL